MVINRLREESEAIVKHAQQMHLRILGYIPEDGNIAKHDLMGSPLLKLPNTSPSVLAVEKILGEIGLGMSYGDACVT